MGAIFFSSAAAPMDEDSLLDCFLQWVDGKRSSMCLVNVMFMRGDRYLIAFIFIVNICTYLIMRLAGKILGKMMRGRCIRNRIRIKNAFSCGREAKMEVPKFRRERMNKMLSDLLLLNRAYVKDLKRRRHEMLDCGEQGPWSRFAWAVVMEMAFSEIDFFRNDLPQFPITHHKLLELRDNPRYVWTRPDYNRLLSTAAQMMQARASYVMCLPDDPIALLMELFADPKVNLIKLSYEAFVIKSPGYRLDENSHWAILLAGGNQLRRLI